MLTPIGDGFRRGGAVVDAGADQLLDRIHTEPSNRHARCHDESVASQPLPVRECHGLDRIGDLDAGHLGPGEDLGAELERL